MYPLYWTHQLKGVLFMKYSYEYKKQCVMLYRQGKWPEIPKDIRTKTFRNMIRTWVRIEDAQGPEALQHKGKNKYWTADKKLALIANVYAGNSMSAVACQDGINPGMLYTWVRKYEELGYTGLIPKQKGRPSMKKHSQQRNPYQPRHLQESEYEELIRLRAENEYMKAEIAVIKKEITLREEKQAARLKAKKQRLPKHCEAKDTDSSTY